MTIRTKYAIAASLVAGVLAAAPSHAQSAGADTRWRAWLGCWEPITPDGGTPLEAQGLRVCVVPSTGTSAVDIVNVANGKVAERTHVEASAEKRAIGREGCTGVESAAWSPDNRRVYLQAEISCDGVRRTTSGLLAFSPSGEWLDVQGVRTGTASGVHVTRYRPVANLTGIPVEIAQALGNMQLAVSTARGAAAAPIVADDVVDAVKHVDKPVVEAWLVERGQGFDLDAKHLVALADAGVPGSVTDLMVALSYPKVFAINRASRDAEALAPGRAGGNTTVSGRTIPVYASNSCYSDFGWGPYSRYSSWYNSCGYGYNSYYNGYNGYYNGWYYGNQPIIIVNRGDASAPGVPTETTHPRIVKGQGATEGRTVSQPSTSSGSSSSGSSSGSGTSSGSTSSGSTGRTAHPRTP